MRKLGSRTLNIKGIVLDNEQLQNYMEKIAINYNVKSTSKLETYPIPRLNQNYKFIEKTYNLLVEHSKKGIDVHSAGEWLLDNFYMIEETIKIILKELNLKKYKNLPGIGGANYDGFARIYVIASELVAYTDCKISDENLKTALMAYQRRKTLTMEEIWTLSIFLQIATIENIRTICEKIYSAQMQKYRVENIVERLVEKKNDTDQKFREAKSNYGAKVSYREIKLPFIEYMSYKLKQYGKQGISYLNILEEEVNKIGMTVSEVIEKEHYDIATQKVLMGNCITSLRDIVRINFLELFEKINGVEEILKKDPANVFKKMDYKTKAYYRGAIKNLAKKTKMSENYIATTALGLAKKYQTEPKDKKAHIGYYLVSEGFGDLLKSLNINKKIKTKKEKANQYIYSIFIITSLLSLASAIFLYLKSKSIVVSLLTFILTYIPISEIYIQILNYILLKKVKPTLIPKLDYINKIPKDATTMVVIPTIIKDKEKVVEIMHKLEVYYIANKSENIYFALLGDCSASKKEEEPFDEEVMKAGIEECNRLNEKYCKNIAKKFYFLYRKRLWNEGEKSFLGWERKRGLLTELNAFLVEGTNNFRVNTITEAEENFTKSIKYIITLDSDTNLVLNSAFELIGAMAHILNKPVINERQNVVVEGHGIIQPRVGVDLESSRKSLLTQIYSGQGGTDVYANAISDVYQDNFDEGIFTGKGIYDLKTFYKVLNDAIPENKVLSHDLLEGSYLRCGLATDILLIDGCPSKYNSLITRMERWVRGDWQIMDWLTKRISTKDGTKKTNPLNRLSKFKILDNLRRSLVPVSAFFLLTLAVIFKLLKIDSSVLIILAIFSLLMPTILDLINRIVFKKNTDLKLISAHKNMIKVVNGLKASTLRGILELSFLPYRCFIMVFAITKTLYRLNFSKKHLLEWTTAEEAEKRSKTDLKSYYKNMAANVIASISLFILGGLIGNLMFILFSFFFLIGPYWAWYISREEKEKTNIEKISNQDKKYLLEIGKRTWQFFKDNINEKNNFLPPDNYQEDRKEKIAYRTSPTNIGLGILAVMSGYDLKYIDLKTAMETIEQMLYTIEKLEKWNGHLYNWYNTKTLEPLTPRYVSTVDSGNLIGYLYTLKTFLVKKNGKPELIDLTDRLINNTDFKVLYNDKKRLFSIGFNIEENRQTDSYYDLLASEARQMSLIAIAKKDIDAKHWNSLSRTLTSLNKYKGLVSWTGTAFEYLMPNINVKRYKGSLLDESCRFMIMSQKEYAKKLRYSLGYFRSGI